MTGPADWSDWAYLSTVRPNKYQSSMLQAMDHSVAGSMTAQPPGFRPSVLQVATHGQQVGVIGEGGS